MEVEANSTKCAMQQWVSGRYTQVNSYPVDSYMKGRSTRTLACKSTYFSAASYFVPLNLGSILMIFCTLQ